LNPKTPFLEDLVENDVLDICTFIVGVAELPEMTSLPLTIDAKSTSKPAPAAAAQLGEGADINATVHAV
jgi:hypothetical protein